MNNDQFIHLFVNNPTEYTASCNNLSCHNGILYSYRLPIGYRSPIGLIILENGCSHTTSRHISSLKHASNHLVYFLHDDIAKLLQKYQEDVDHHVQRLVNYIAQYNTQKIVTVFNDLANQKKRALPPVQSITAPIYDLLHLKIDNQINFYTMGKEQLILENLDKLQWTSEHYQDQLPLGQQFKSYWHYIQPTLLEVFEIDISKKLKYFEATKERKEKAEKTRLANLQKKAEYKAIQWLNFAPYNFYDVLRSIPPLLRLDGDIIQTSHGASVPLTRALELLPILKSNPRELIGQSIGDFTIRDIDPNNIKIGCHTIPLPTIIKFFKTLEAHEND